MIAENNVSFGPNGEDEGSIIHLMATVPEARSNGVATSMVQHFVNREMEKTDILVVVMYPKEMRPMAVDIDEMIDLRKKNLNLAGVDVVEKYQRYQTLSPVYFLMNNLQCLVWDHFTKKIHEHTDMEDAVCMFTEKEKIQNLNTRHGSTNKLLKNAHFIEVEFGNCNAFKLSRK